MSGVLIRKGRMNTDAQREDGVKRQREDGPLQAKERGVRQTVLSRFNPVNPPLIKN
jgi:hypothetical protein